MGWDAVDAIEESVKDTKELLLPFNLKTWAKLALIAALVGGAGVNFPGSIPSGGNSYDPGTSDFSNTDLNTALDTGNMLTGAAISSPSAGSAAVAGIIILLAGLLFGYLYVSSVFEFIYYRSLVDRDVSIRKNFRRYWGEGLRYFGFKLGTLAVVLLGVAGAIGLVILNPMSILLLVLVLIPLGLVFGLFTMLVHDFVLLRMMEENEKLIEALKNLYPTFRNRWKDLAIYYILKMVFGVMISIYGIVALLGVLLVLAIPFGILGFIASLVYSPLVLLVAGLGIVSFIVAMAFVVLVPTNTFLYYYAINMYHRMT